MGNLRYQLNQKKSEKINIQLLYITQAKYGNDWHCNMHTHHFTEIFYVVKGQGKFLVNSNEIIVNEDDLILVNPNVSHTESSINNNESFEYIVLGVNGLQFLNETTLDNGKHHEFSIHNYYEYKHEVLFYLKTILNEVRNEEKDYESICQNLLEVLIINLVRRTNKNILIAPTKKVNKECQFIEQYNNDNFKEDITLDTLSELTYLNKYYIVHSFKKYKNISPINYLNAVRIEEAKNLLATTDYSVAHISNLIGFSSQSYFSQVFKKDADMTPNVYRKKALENQ